MMRGALCLGALANIFLSAANASVHVQSAGVSPSGGGLFSHVGIQSGRVANVVEI